MTVYPHQFIFMKMKSVIFLLCIGCCTAINAQKNRSTAWEYAVVFNSSVKTYLSFFNNAISDTQLTAKVEGSLNLYIKTDRQKRSHVCGRFAALSKLQLPLPDYVAKEVSECLMSGFCFTQDGNGVVDSIFFPEVPTEAAEHIVIQLVEGFQYYRNDIANGVALQHELSLSDGKVMANFRQSVEGAGQTTLVLDSLRSVQQRSSRQVELVPQHTLYNTTVRFGIDKEAVVPISIEGFITRESRISHRLASRMVNNYSFLRGKKITAAFVCPGYQYSRPLFYPERLTLVRQKQLADRAEKIKYQQLEEALLAVTDSTPELPQMHIGDDLNAVLSTGTFLPVIEDLFIRSDPRSARFKLIRGALINAATPAAQEMIGRLIRQYRLYDPSLLRYIIPSAGLMKTPGYELQYELEDLVADSLFPAERKASVYLALGNMAGQLNEINISRADSLVKRIIVQLENNNDAILLLSVLGNAGTQYSLSVIRPFLQDSSTAVSSMAYYAMRFIDDPAVDELYVSALIRSDLRDDRRIAAILEALFYRAYQPAISSLMEKMMKNGAVELQLLYLQLICHHSYKETSLIELIREIGSRYLDNETGKAANSFIEKAGL